MDWIGLDLKHFSNDIKYFQLYQEINCWTLRCNEKLLRKQTKKRLKCFQLCKLSELENIECIDSNIKFKHNANIHGILMR